MFKLPAIVKNYTYTPQLLLLVDAILDLDFKMVESILTDDVKFNEGSKRDFVRFLKFRLYEMQERGNTFAIASKGMCHISCGIRKIGYSFIGNNEPERSLRSCFNLVFEFENNLITEIIECKSFVLKNGKMRYYWLEYHNNCNSFLCENTNLEVKLESFRKGQLEFN